MLLFVFVSISTVVHLVPRRLEQAIKIGALPFEIVLPSFFGLYAVHWSLYTRVAVACRVSR